jgi:hypothetical protein
MRINLIGFICVVSPCQNDSHRAGIHSVYAETAFASAVFVDNHRVAGVKSFERQIADYWVVNAAEQVIHVYRSHRSGSYESVQTIHAGERVAALAAPDLELDPADLFG